MNRKRLLAVMPVLGLWLLFPACDRVDHVDSPTAPHARLSASLGDSARDVPAVQLRLPPQARAFYSDAGALEVSIRARDGLAYVAFKAPSAGRALEAHGRRAEVRAGDVRQALDVVQRSGGTVVSFFHLSGMVLARLPSGVATELLKSPFIDFVEPALNPVAETGLSAQPLSLPRAGATQSGAGFQPVPWNVTLVNAPSVWPLTTGEGAKLMILGQGLRTDPDLPTIPGSNCGGFMGACGDQSAPADATLMAGVMLERYNSVGTVGVAPGIAGTSVYVWKVWPDNRTIDISFINLGLQYAVDHGIRTVVMDFLHETYSPTEDANIQAAWAGGVTMVSGVGGLGQYREKYYPASYANVIGVSGTRPDGVFAESGTCWAGWGSGSNYGPMVTLAAPLSGVTTFGNGLYLDLWSAVLPHLCNTKLAAAHVAAIAALVQARHPDWGPGPILEALRATASGHGRRIDDRYGFGLVNAAAVNYSPPLSVTIGGPNSVLPFSNCSFFASSGDGTEPFAYAWTADGYPVGDGSPVLRYSAGDSSFFLSVTVTDAHGRVGVNGLGVAVDPGAPACWDQ